MATQLPQVWELFWEVWKWVWDAFHSHALRYLQQVSLADVVAGRIPEGILAPRERTAPAGPAGPAAAAAGATAQAADGAV